MNIYNQRFSAECVNNGRRVAYQLTIETHVTIMVEDIQSEVSKLARGYHEEFAEQLFARFGGRQTLSAHHHGTDITTVRP